ncbi:MAG: hypothetical protein M1814_006202 [Vezdaea aestivalis]|nr:MAG: hypothetical protein M1814_006202 [Vezdaea aestivalis]
MDTTYIEPPETPAPLFAFRAIRNVLFGAPRTTQKPSITIETNDEPVANAGSTAVYTSKTSDTVPCEELGLDLSPTKRQGILLTPGTAGGRRKTVTFGEGVQDNVDRKLVPGKRSGLPNSYPGKFPSPWTPKQRSRSASRRPNAFAETLIQARDTSDTESQPQSTRTANSSNWEDVEDDIAINDKTTSAPDTDTTLNLDEPRSTSGQYWKAKYEHHHERTRREIKKVVAYKTLAKSYAQKKDRHATALEAKLDEERGRVISMEKEVSVLARKITALEVSGPTGKETQAELVSHLAQRTVDTLEYKRRVDQFEDAISKSSSRQRDSHQEKHSDQEWKALKAELASTKDSLRNAEKQVKKSELEHSSLAKELHNAQEDLHRSEQRRTKQEERLQQHKKRLDEQTSRHRERLSELSAENRRLEEVIRDQKKKTTEAKERANGKVARQSQTQQNAKASVDNHRFQRTGQKHQDTIEFHEERHQPMVINSVPWREPRMRRFKETEHTQHSWSQSRSDKALDLPRTAFQGAEETDPFAPVPSPTANRRREWKGPANDIDEAMGFDGTAHTAAGLPPMDHSPVRRRARAASFNSTIPDLPSFEDFSQSGILSSQIQTSQRRPIFDIPSSPPVVGRLNVPRQAPIKEEEKPPRIEGDVEKKLMARRTEMPSSRLETVPQERVAAAKIRLQERKARKSKRPLSPGDAEKENISG